LLKAPALCEMTQSPHEAQLATGPGRIEYRADVLLVLFLSNIHSHFVAMQQAPPPLDFFGSRRSRLERALASHTRRAAGSS